MFSFLRKKKGQSTAEYAILIALVVAAVVGMQTYAKRGWQARTKDAGDDYVQKLANDPNWSSISDTPASLSGQHEDETISSRSTQEVLSGSYESSNMTDDGMVTRESVQKTKQAAEDYREYSY